MTYRMLVMGLGYSGEAVAREADRRGFRVTGTKRNAAATSAACRVIDFESATEALTEATHLVVTAPPGEEGDPALAAYRQMLPKARALRWIGYISSTGVYGDRQGQWMDETSEPRPMQPRSRRRRATELAWQEATPDGVALDVFRAGGIYGPGRSAIDEMRSGSARRIIRPGHVFSRIHRNDIALAVTVAALGSPRPGVRILHLVDDEPAGSAAVVEEAARLLGLAAPPPLPYERAVAGMSPMARSFWDESRRVSSERTKAALGISWRYPTFREGLAGILAEERFEVLPQQG